MSVLWSALGFILVIGILVTLHEAGHYLTAKWLNIKATVFSIGFGRPIIRRQWGETEFRLAWIPLGGYVKFVDERDPDQVIAEEDLPRAFNRQSVYKRFAVVLAGPLVNLLFAWLVFAWMYGLGVSGVKPLFDSVKTDSALYHALSETASSGEQAPSLMQIAEINGHLVQTWQGVRQQLLQAIVSEQSHVDLQVVDANSLQPWAYLTLSLAELDVNQPKQDSLGLLGFELYRPKIPAILGQLVSGAPAENAGLIPDDHIIAFNQQPIEDWSDLVSLIQAHPGQTVNLQIKRNGQEFVQSVTLETVVHYGQPQGRLGASVQIDEMALSQFYALEKYDFYSAFAKGYQHSVDLISMSLTMLQRMIFGEVSLANLSGPVTIAHYSGHALENGLIAFLSLLGLVSLSLGILNLLPIPVLDGGHLTFYLIEMLKGSPVSESVQLVAQKVGIFLLLSLTFIALFNDVVFLTNG